MTIPMKTLTLAFGLAAALGLCSCAGTRAGETAAAEIEAIAPSGDASSGATAAGDTVEAWLIAYPFQARTDSMTAEGGRGDSAYGGSEPFARRELMPELDVNFKGIAFSVEYNEDRGHASAWKDLVMSRRVNASTPAACMTCKTGDIGEVFAEKGWSYASMPLSAFTAEEHPSITCANCHDLSTGHLEPRQPGFIEALVRQGIELDSVPADRMSAYVCAQCHSEYYFEPVTRRVVHPWDGGLSAAAAYAYYQGQPSGFLGDFTQPDSSAMMLKAQHPDYEEYSAGVHAAAGVACADCHMGKVDDGGVIKTSHRIASPLSNIEGTCMACHTDRDAAWLRSRVAVIQDTVFAAQRDAGQAVAAAHGAIAAAAAAGSPAARLAAARLLVREAQWYWDWVASANSMGFHAPVAALGNLAKATDLAHKARLALAGQ